MVAAMASAYGGLSEDDRERAFLLAVGRDDFKSMDQNFCRGFAACADDGASSWWTNWQVAQRDVFFYTKTDPSDDDSWEYYCRYSMNTGRDEFDDTLREMLEVTAAAKLSFAGDDDIDATMDDMVGNETTIEISKGQSPVFVSMEAGPSRENASSSSSNRVLFSVLSVAALSWWLA